MEGNLCCASSDCQFFCFLFSDLGRIRITFVLDDIHIHNVLCVQSVASLKENSCQSDSVLIFVPDSVLIFVTITSQHSTLDFVLFGQELVMKYYVSSSPNWVTED